MEKPQLTRFGAPRVGILPSGDSDAIGDVPGVAVGHCTRADGPVQTGVSVVLPATGNLFMDKLPAGVAVLNGFGKSAGLMQVEELGTLESPIVLTNTLAVGTAYTALVRAAIAENPELARSLPTVNPLVLECNDGWLNEAQALSVSEADVASALAAARRAQADAAFAPIGAAFAQGSVGAGRGMSCHGLKGGVGSASRIFRAGQRDWRIGVLALANHGRLAALTLAGRRLGPVLQARLQQRMVQEEKERKERQPPEADVERGSIIMLLATDAPLDARQLRRLARRAGIGLARSGSDYGHGSGDIALAWSTAYRIPQSLDAPMPAVAMLHEAALDGAFQAAAEASEQAILHALFCAETVHGRDGRVRYALTDLAPDWADLWRDAP